MITQSFQFSSLTLLFPHTSCPMPMRSLLSSHFKMSPKYDYFLLPPLLLCWFKKLSSLAWTFAFIFILQPPFHFAIPYPKSAKAAREVLLKCLLEYSNGYFSYSEKNLKSLQTAYNTLHDWVLTHSPLSTSNFFNLLQPAHKHLCWSLYMPGCSQWRILILAVPSVCNTFPQQPHGAFPHLLLVCSDFFSSERSSMTAVFKITTLFRTSSRS